MARTTRRRQDALIKAHRAATEQADQTNGNQVQRDDVIQEFGHHQDQDTRDQRDQRSQAEVQVHLGRVPSKAKILYFIDQEQITAADVLEQEPLMRVS